MRQNDLRELEISLPIRPPVLFVKVHLAGVVMEEGPKDGVGETVVVAIRDIVVEVDGLAGVFLHEYLVDVRSVLRVDVETRPSNPSESHGLFATGKGGYETTRGHLEVVLPLGILGNCDWETVGDNDEVLGPGNVWDPGEACVGGGSWDGHNEGSVVGGGEIGETFGSGDFQRCSVIYLAYIRQALVPDTEDNPDISLFPYPAIGSRIPTGSS